jgi:hypothetical protein
MNLALHTLSPHHDPEASPALDRDVLRDPAGNLMRIEVSR